MPERRCRSPRARWRTSSDRAPADVAPPRLARRCLHLGAEPRKRAATEATRAGWGLRRPQLQALLEARRPWAAGWTLLVTGRGPALRCQESMLVPVARSGVEAKRARGGVLVQRRVCSPGQWARVDGQTRARECGAARLPGRPCPSRVAAMRAGSRPREPRPALATRPVGLWHWSAKDRVSTCAHCAPRFPRQALACAEAVCEVSGQTRAEPRSGTGVPAGGCHGPLSMGGDAVLLPVCKRHEWRYAG